MKQFIYALALISALASCRQQDPDPVVEEADKSVRLARISYTYTRDGSTAVKKSYEIIYDKTGKRVEKINRRVAPLSTFDNAEPGDNAVIVFAYDEKNVIKSALIAPVATSANNQIEKYFYTYTGDKFTSYLKEGEGLTSLAYDDFGNVTKTEAENPYESSIFYYTNNVLSYWERSSRANANYNFSDLINPLAKMDKGLAHVLVNDFYAMNTLTLYTVPFYFQPKYLSSSTFRAQPGSRQPTTTTYTVKESKQNYPLKVEVMNDEPFSRIQNEKVVLEYTYVNL